MDPLSIGITVGTSLLSGIGSLFSSSTREREEERRRNAAIKTLRENLIDENELDKMLSNTERLFNNRLISTLNKTAIRTRGLANRGVVAGAVAGELEGQKAGALSDIQNRVLQGNIQTNTQIASLQSAGGEAYDPVGSFFQGAIPGLTAGLELTKYVNESSKTVPGQTKPEVSTTPQVVPNNQPTNPFIGKNKIDDGMLNGFMSPFLIEPY